MKIIQIAPVVENYSFPNMDQVYPNENATIYGLGEDGKPYIWTRIEHRLIQISEW